MKPSYLTQLRVLSTFTLLLALLFASNPLHGSGTIMIVTDRQDLEAGTLGLAGYLRSLGYDVEVNAGNPSEFRGSLDAAKIARLEAKDLVIVHRATDSGQFNPNTATRDAWNSLDVPMLLMSAFLARSAPARWNWADGDQSARATFTDHVFQVPDHPIVAGLTTSMFDAPRNLNVLASMGVGTGTVVASAPGSGASIAVWPEPNGQTLPFRSGPETYRARRVFFALHNYHEAGAWTDISENGKELIARAVTFTMTGAVGPVPPRIEDVSPTNNTRFLAANEGISFRVTSTGEPIPAGNISLVLNGIDVTASLNVGGTELNRTVTFSHLEANVVYHAVITVSNVSGAERTFEFRFDTIDVVDVVIVEAEDYNFESDGDCDPPFIFYVELGGGYLAQPFPGSYRNRLGSPEIDFLDNATTFGDPVLNAYRHCDAVATTISSDVKRQEYDATGEEEYDVAQIATGDWMNYTREFLPGNYRVYLRASSAGPAQIAFSRVTGDPSVRNQSTLWLGTFEVAATAGAYEYVPVFNAGTQEPLIISISGVDTFRLTALAGHSSLLLNYFVFVPTSEEATVLGPMVSSRSPAPGEVDVRHTTPISVTIANRLIGVNPGSIELRVNDQDVTGSAQISSEEGAVVITFLPPGGFAFGSTQSVNLSFEDASGNPLSTEWSFTVRPTEVMVLFVLLNPGAMNASDSGIKARLESFGYTVISVADGASQTAHAANKDLVVVSSTIGSGAVNVKFRDVTIPVINWEQALQDDFMMTLDDGAFRGTIVTQTSLNIVNPDHPLAAGLEMGTHQIVTAAQTYSWGVPNENAAVVATLVDNPDRALIYAYEPGSSMIGDFVAPARRIHLFLEDNTFAVLNEAGLRLFDAAIAYALQQDGDPAPPEFAAPTIVDGEIQLSWTGTGRLQEAPDVTGDWTDVTPAPAGNSYSAPAAGARKFFRLVR
jgi:hypothetical protein